MKTTSITIILVSLLLLINSCSTIEQTTTDRKLRFSILGGANSGGITDNTDMDVVPNVNAPHEATVDAVSGATQIGFNAGIHINKPLKRNQVETGIDYMYNHQIFKYNDPGNMYKGIRELYVSQVLFPLTYNFVLLKKQFPDAGIQLKAGYLGQLNFVTTKDSGELPDYSLKSWSNGLTIGVSAFPFQFNKGSKLGVYFDLYRGSQIYEDYYNQASFDMPGTSFIKFGIKYQFK